MVLVKKKRTRKPLTEWDRFFDGVFAPVQSGLHQAEPVFKPRTDVLEVDGGFLVRLDLPGVEKENIEVSAHDGILSIKATLESNTSEEDENHRWIRRERHTGSYQRDFTLEDTIDEESISASFENGVLEVRLVEKTAPELEPRRINID